MWRIGRLGRPGVYEVRRGDAPVLAVAATIPADESDLRSLAGEVIRERLSGGRAIHVRSAEQRREAHDNRWVSFAVACVACLMAELAALVWWRA